MDSVWRWTCALVLLCLSACGGGGGSSGTTAVPAAPVVVLSTTASDVAVNAAVTLTWSATNATSCTASGGWTGTRAASGAVAVSVPQAQTQTFTLACTGAGGSGSASTQVTAWNAPTVSITAADTDLLVGNATTVTWSSQNATACSGSGGLAAAQPTTGSFTSAALATTTNFTLSCSNPGFAAVSASALVNVSATLSLAVTLRYEAPGAPIINATGTAYVPNWASPVSAIVPFVYAELLDGSGRVVQWAWADQNGVATFSGLSPSGSYTPRFESRVQYTPLALDFQVLNNVAPTNTASGTFRGRYPAYSTTAAPYSPTTRQAHQAVAVTLPDGWNATTSALVDANRVAGPYELLATAAQEALIMSHAMGGAPVWPRMTILWSTVNKGGKTAPPNNFDQGLVTGSGGSYDSSHGALDTAGTPSGSVVSEDYIYLSGDVTYEAMEIYPFVMAHEMGHFIQRQFSRSFSRGGSHAYSDYEDARLSWGEGNASGIAMLVLGTPEERRVYTQSGEIAVSSVDISRSTVNGNPQTWPVGWFQELTIANLMWSARDPAGSIALTPEAALAPMFSAQWTAQPWAGTVWAYVNGLKTANPSVAAQIDTWAAAHGIDAAGDDVWGTFETHAGNRSAQDVLPPYTQISLGVPLHLCSAGAVNEYNKAGNSRYLRLAADATPRALTAQGAAGTVPDLVVNGQDHFSAGQSTITVSAVTSTTAEVVVAIGDCSVMYSPFATDLPTCQEPATPAAEQCWTLTLQ